MVRQLGKNTHRRKKRSLSKLVQSSLINFSTHTNRRRKDRMTLQKNPYILTFCSEMCSLREHISPMEDNVKVKQNRTKHEHHMDFSKTHLNRTPLEENLYMQCQVYTV